MSREGYEKALTKARETAELFSNAYADERLRETIAMWSTLAIAEAQDMRSEGEIAQQAQRVEQMAQRNQAMVNAMMYQVTPEELVRKNLDLGVVGARCEKCRHFLDNHTADGCRECGCEVERLA